MNKNNEEKVVLILICLYVGFKYMFNCFKVVSVIFFFDLDDLDGFT